MFEFVVDIILMWSIPLSVPEISLCDGFCDGEHIALYRVHACQIKLKLDKVDSAKLRGGPLST